MPANVRVSSSWKTVAALHTRVGGSWKNVTEGYTKIGGAWKAFFTSVVPLTVDHLVIAGGGGGGAYWAGGGGAGGYRTSAGTSGGGAAAESRVSVAVATNYTVTVGSGGAYLTNGSNSVFSTITSTGGGRGGTGGGSASGGAAQSGGSGGGGGSSNTIGLSGASGTTNQGFAGGNSPGATGTYPSAGGGGAGAAGVSPANTSSGGGNGGAGVASSITGTSVTRAGGGGGNGSSSTSGGSGGSGGGGNGGTADLATGNVVTAGSNGTANTGGGGGGGNTSGGPSTTNGWSGGSGVVILKYPSTFAINPSPGLSHRTVTSAGFNITTFTAGTGTVTFAAATTSSYELIQTVYLTASQSSVTFDVSGLGSDYQHLQLRMTGRTTRAVSEDGAPIMYFNSDTSSSYRSHYLVGTGSSVVSYDNGTNMGLGSYPGANAGANQFLASVVDILDPFETTKNKTIRVLAGMPGSFNSVRLNSGVWFSTNALTSIQLNANSGSWATGTRISLYGLKGS